jgi:hypothetical protein
MDLYPGEGVIQRNLDDPDLFADLGITYLGYHQDSEGVRVLEFEEELTPEQIEAVNLRLFTTPDEEQSQRLLDEIEPKINALIQSTGTMPADQMSDAIRTLAQVVGLVRVFTRQWRQ